MTDQERARQLAVCLDGAIAFRQYRLRQALQKLDPHAAQVLPTRIRQGDRQDEYDDAPVGSLARELGEAFLWHGTREGKAYWRDLCRKLNDHPMDELTPDELES